MNTRGLSFIEMMMALLIAAMLMAVTVPGLKNFIYHAKDEIWRNELLRAIDMARTEAQLRKLPVAMCKTMDKKTCSGAWADGLLIFIDDKRDGSIHSKEQILKIITPPYHGSLYWRLFPAYRSYLLFLPDDFTGSDNGTFWHCHDGLSQWAIMISKSGRTRVAFPDQHGVIKDSRGKVLNCDDTVSE